MGRYGTDFEDDEPIGRVVGANPERGTIWVQLTPVLPLWVLGPRGQWAITRSGQILYGPDRSDLREQVAAIWPDGLPLTGAAFLAAVDAGIEIDQLEGLLDDAAWWVHRGRTQEAWRARDVALLALRRSWSGHYGAEYRAAVEPHLIAYRRATAAALAEGLADCIGWLALRPPQD